MSPQSILRASPRAANMISRRMFHATRARLSSPYHYSEGPYSNLPFNTKTRFFAVRYWAYMITGFFAPFGIAGASFRLKQRLDFRGPLTDELFSLANLQAQGLSEFPAIHWLSPILGLDGKRQGLDGTWPKLPVKDVVHISTIEVEAIAKESKFRLSPMTMCCLFEPAC